MQYYNITLVNPSTTSFHLLQLTLIFIHFFLVLSACGTPLPHPVSLQPLWTLSKIFRRFPSIEYSLYY